MADERITLVALRKLLSERTGCNEQDAGNYLNNLFASITEGLKTDGQVRIAGLGLFKVQWTAPRRSINIQTGEPITLEGYNKVVFVPENSLKERINEPFAHLEAIVIGDRETADISVNPMQKLNEQAAEIKDILAELGAVTTDTISATSCENTLVADNYTQTDTDTEENKQPAIIIGTTDTNLSTPAEETLSPKTGEKPTADQHAHSAAPFHPWMAAGITMLVFCLLLTGGYFFLQHKITSWADNMLLKNPPPTTRQLITTTSEISDTVPISSASERETINETDTIVQDDLLKTITYTSFITTETLTEGSRLTWLSRKYYGAPDFWVYIYEANKDILPNPNRINIGTQIRIPKLPKELIDTQNEESMQLARQLHEKILGQ